MPMLAAVLLLPKFPKEKISFKFFLIILLIIPIKRKIIFIMTEEEHPIKKEEKNIALIGRGESVLTAITKGDESGNGGTPPEGIKEGDEEAVDFEEKHEEAMQLLEESAGCLFPKVKLSSWDPEEEKEWERVGKRIASRNLWASIPNLTCGFGVWLVWSVIVNKIQLMHDEDPDVYPFQDWGSPTGADVSLTSVL